MQERYNKNIKLTINKITNLSNKTEIYRNIKDKFFWARLKSKIYKFNGFRLWVYKSFTKKFKVRGNIYNYFYHKYNNTWLTERTVEIPVIWEIITRYIGKNILEIGNVLSHYFDFKHDIVDKYEKANGVLNQDIVDYNPNKVYDLIISISTLEHIGWNETPIKPLKILDAIKKLKQLLACEGKIIITLPIGWNPHLDKLLIDNKIKYYNKICLKRISENNKWKEILWDKIRDLDFNNPFPSANGLIILFIKKEK